MWRVVGGAADVALLRGFFAVAPQPGVSSWWASATNRSALGPDSLTLSSHCIRLDGTLKQFSGSCGPDSVNCGLDAGVFVSPAAGAGVGTAGVGLVVGPAELDAEELTLVGEGVVGSEPAHPTASRQSPMRSRRIDATLRLLLTPPDGGRR